LRRVSPVSARPAEGPLTEPIAGVQPAGRELVFMPLSGHWLPVIPGSPGPDVRML